MKRFSEKLYTLSTPRITLIIVLIFLVFTAVALPRQAQNAPPDVGTPDTSLYYSPEELYNMAQAYGESGRRAYIVARFTFDVLWPVIYSAFFLSLTSLMLSKLSSSDSRWRTWNLLPLLGTTFDFLENFSTSWVMWRYPAKASLAGTLASIFTPLK